ncbi:6747_t:CDS:2 [Cetraspora pellucida]|uniref:6747_t:CDS:1 n=1 Tax=Cetraspora pellucida TaxID=1433469 RepID=A0A9N8WIN3_9GLOM|nr:6747_t:CDS:2 [Cetraspora pellucida]
MTAKVRKPAPNFTANAVVDGQFKEVSLSDYTGQSDFTLVCPTEIIAFSDRVDEFKKLNTAVLAASCDSQFHGSTLQETKSITKSYGILVEEEGLPLRGLFIIDDKGIIRQITINDLTVGRNIDEILRLVEAFQFTDKHGEVCPIGWKKGDKAIDVKKGQDYFSETYKD